MHSYKKAAASESTNVSFLSNFVSDTFDPTNCICVFVLVKKNGGLTSKNIEIFAIFRLFLSKSDLGPGDGPTKCRFLKRSSEQLLIDE